MDRPGELLKENRSNDQIVDKEYSHCRFSKPHHQYGIPTKQETFRKQQVEQAAENLTKVCKTESLLMFSIERIHKHLADQCPYCWTPTPPIFCLAFHGADIPSLIADNPFPCILNRQHDQGHEMNRSHTKPWFCLKGMFTTQFCSLVSSISLP